MSLTDFYDQNDKKSDSSLPSSCVLYPCFSLDQEHASEHFGSQCRAVLETTGWIPFN